MSDAIRVIVFAAVLAASAIAMSAGRAHCSWCPRWTCYSSEACRGCVCLREQPWVGGRCVSLAP